MKTEDLIVDLARRATPVRPLLSPAVRLLVWSSLAVASVATGLLYFGIRSDAAAAAGRTGFAATAVFALCTAGLAGWTSLTLAVPGAERSPALRRSAIALLTLWTTWLIVAIVRDGYSAAALAHSPACFSRVLAIAVVPAIALAVMLRRAAPLRLASAGALTCIAASAAAALAIQFICPLDDPAHGLSGHLGPVIAVAILGAWLGPRLLARPFAV